MKMKKKIFAIIMVMTLCVSFCACGGGTTATITDNEGNTVQMTAEDLEKISDENEAKFEDLYKGAEIELTDTVESVSSDTVSLKGGWKVQLSKSKHADILAELSKGDSVYVKSNISIVFDGVELKGMHGISYDDDTLKTTVFRKSEDQKEYQANFDTAYSALSDEEKAFYDEFSDRLKSYVQNDGIGEFTSIHAWEDDKYTYFYLENKGPASTWMRIGDGSSATASSAKTLHINEDASPILDDYDNVMEVINLYLDL